MKPAARNVSALVVSLVLMLLFAPACAIAAGPRALFSAGTNDYFWSADVNPNPTPEQPDAVLTTIRVRTAGDQLKWQPAGEIAQAPLSLSTSGKELLIVFADGEWKFLGTSGMRSGGRLPNNSKVLALAGDGAQIWAIGGLDLVRRATTRSTTQPTTAATAPARPPHPLALFRLDRGDWTQVADVPVEYKPEQIAAASLAVMDGKLTLAIVGPDRAIRLFTRSGDGWSAMHDAGTLNEKTQIKLLDVRGRPALWVAPENGAGELRYASDGWSKPVKLAPSPKLDGFDQRSIAFALGQLRLLATDGKSRVAEQLYNPDGTLLGEPSEAQTGPSELEKRVSTVIQFIVMAALLAWMLGSLRQRPNLAEIIAKIDQLHVAPLGKRFLGGLIDAVPFLVGFIASLIIAARSETQASGPINLKSLEVAVFCAGLGVYFLHTTLAELLAGRSLGKVLTGTRVASIDGTPPRVSQILARNALRLIDLIILGVPLLAVFQSPLRQRVADMMAGTTVVLNTPPLTPDGSNPPPTMPAPPPPPTSEPPANSSST